MKKVLRPAALLGAVFVLLGVMAAGGVLLGGSKTRTLFSSSAEALNGDVTDAGRPASPPPHFGGTKSGVLHPPSTP